MEIVIVFAITFANYAPKTVVKSVKKVYYLDGNINKNPRKHCNISIYGGFIPCPEQESLTVDYHEIILLVRHLVANCYGNKSATRHPSTLANLYTVNIPGSR